MIDRAKFFNAVRPNPFDGSLTEDAVKGMNAILDEWERRKLADLRWLAYMLATVRGECGPQMLPVREGTPANRPTISDAAARAHVARQGYKYAAPVGGKVFYGRGLVQLTWHRNYSAMSAFTGINLVTDPERALEPAVAAKIMFEGMIRGTFTSKKLAHYFNDKITNWVQARRIINGMDKAEKFAGFARAFHAALVASASVGVVVASPKAPEPMIPPTSTPEKGVIVGGPIVTGEVVRQAVNSGADLGTIIFFVVAALVITGAVVLGIRHFRNRD